MIDFSKNIVVVHCCRFLWTWSNSVATAANLVKMVDNAIIFKKLSAGLRRSCSGSLMCLI